MPRLRARVSFLVMAIVPLLACAGRSGDDTGGDGASGSTSATSSPEGTDAEGPQSASQTSAMSGTDDTALPMTSGTTAPSSEDTTTAGTIACDPEACESIDLETCALCDRNDCTLLYGRIWGDVGPEPCLAGTFPIACQGGLGCFDYYQTLCDAEGQAFDVEMSCPDLDLDAAGLEVCEPPNPDAQPDCEAG